MTNGSQEHKRKILTGGGSAACVELNATVGKGYHGVNSKRGKGTEGARTASYHDEPPGNVLKNVPRVGGGVGGCSRARNTMRLDVGAG